MKVRGAARAIASVTCCLLITLQATVAPAADPLAPGGGNPLHWDQDRVVYRIEAGSLGLLDQAEVARRVEQAFATWASVATADLPPFEVGRPLARSIDGSNYREFRKPCESLNGDDASGAVVLDNDGSIITDFYGEGSATRILGFATIRCVFNGSSDLAFVDVVLNGIFLDGIDEPGNPEVTLDQFQSTITHELGHSMNLGHTQVGLREALDPDISNNATIPLMFPFLTRGGPSNPQLDDVVSLSTLYPTRSFTQDFGTISGSVFLPDGGTPFFGAYLVARRVDDPLRFAVGGLSGVLFRGSGINPSAGKYTLPGLPAGDYIVALEQTVRTFGIGPLGSAPTLPGPEELWNGSNEAGSDPPDDPFESTTLAVSAGQEEGGIDLVINAPNPVPANDTCEHAREVSALPFSDRVDTTYATIDTVRCATMTMADHVVWYHYTAPVASRVMVLTGASSFPVRVAQVAESTVPPVEVLPGCEAFALREIGSCFAMRDSTLLLRLDAGEGAFIALGNRDFTGAGDLRVRIQNCPMDCGGGQDLDIDDVVRAINVALEKQPLEACAAADTSHDGTIGVEELVALVQAILADCGVDASITSR